MEEEISIEYAIERAEIKVNAPPILVLIIPTFISFLIDLALNFHNWLFMLVTFISLISAWLIWSRNLMKWRIWAFSNIRNVHELRKRAEQRNILWPQGSLLSKIEFKFSDLEVKWNDLKSRFEIKDTFIPDESIPEETIILNSKEKNYWILIFSIMICLFGVYLIFEFRNLLLVILSCCLVILAGLNIKNSYSRSQNSKPQIKLSEKGIWIKRIGLIIWKDISDEEVVTESSGRNNRAYLKFQYSNQIQKRDITLLDIDIDVLNKLLIYYRMKNESNNNR